MNARIKALWVAALRSGEYQQARLRLQTDAGYCCLGVLCRLHQKETGEDTFEAARTEGEEVAPQCVVDWADLPDGNPRVMGPHARNNGKLALRALASLNDAGRSFAYIADLIEEQL